MPKAFVDPDRRKRSPSLEDRLVDEARFIKTWLDSPILTGAVSPSGRFLARMMASAVDPAGRGPIVELGPGTGPITQALLSRGVDPKRLLLVEYDGAFCQLLRKRFPDVQVLQADAYDLRQSLTGVLAEPAEAIVSSLPLLTKPDAQRLSLIDDVFALMAPRGSFVQFTYGMRSPVPRAAALDYEAQVSAPVWFNLPPARVWVYRRKSEGAVQLDEAAGHAMRDPHHRGAATGVFRPVVFRAPTGRKRLFRRRASAALRVGK